jgi:GxxExxY protein
METPKERLILEDEVYAIMGAAMEVYYKVGTGFLEPVYQEMLAIEMNGRGIPYEAEKELVLEYKGVTLKKTYRADFICYGQILVEIKALNRLSNIEIAQILNYMKITQMRVGLLINFGARPKLEWKRFVI